MQKQLTLVISGKTETEIDNLVKAIDILLNNSSVQVAASNKTSNDIWNQEVVVASNQTPDEDYWSAADELYSMLIHNGSRFSDWEYTFISNMYARSTEKLTYSTKQKEWIDKLKEKFL